MISTQVGGFTSIASGLCGMLVAVDANARTTVAAASEPPSRLTAAFNVAFRAGKRLEWDAGNMKFPNAPEAETFLKRDYRKGWTL